MDYTLFKVFIIFLGIVSIFLLSFIHSSQCGYEDDSGYEMTYKIVYYIDKLEQINMILLIKYHIDIEKLIFITREISKFVKKYPLYFSDKWFINYCLPKTIQYLYSYIEYSSNKKDLLSFINKLTRIYHNQYTYFEEHLNTGFFTNILSFIKSKKVQLDDTKMKD